MVEKVISQRKELLLNGQPVTVEHKVSRRTRSLRITLYKDGRVILTRPLLTSEARAEAFLYKRATWVLKHIARYKKLVPLIPRYGKKEVANLKSELVRKVGERLEHYNKHYRLTYGTISVRNTKSRWGSCSRKGNLQFSFKLRYIPEHLFDYVIVHELCHLKEFNHGPSFWKLVAETIPKFKERRRELRNIV